MANGAKLVSGLISDVPGPIGFRRKGMIWRRETTEVNQVIHLQRFGERLFVNVGVLLKGIENIQNPLEHQCHLQVRLENLVSNRIVRDSLATLGTRESEAQVSTLFSQALVECLIPYLQDMRLEKEIAAVLNERRFYIAATTLSAKRHLGMPEDFWMKPEGTDSN
jgi:hypothetical protein